MFKNPRVSEWLEVFKHHKDYLSGKYRHYDLGIKLKESQTGKTPKKVKDQEVLKRIKKNMTKKEMK